jgi:hypothetical protein
METVPLRGADIRLDCVQLRGATDNPTRNSLPMLKRPVIPPGVSIFQPETFAVCAG